MKEKIKKMENKQPQIQEESKKSIWLKWWIWLIAIFLIFIIFFGGNEPNKPVSKESQPPIQTKEEVKTDIIEIEKIKSELENVNRKISEIPELEKDIFYKCIEDKEITAKNIRTCEENTQKQIFDLSQDLVNLRADLQSILNKLSE